MPSPSDPPPTPPAAFFDDAAHIKGAALLGLGVGLLPAWLAWSMLRRRRLQTSGEDGAYHSRPARYVRAGIESAEPTLDKRKTRAARGAAARAAVTAEEDDADDDNASTFSSSIRSTVPLQLDFFDARDRRAVDLPSGL